jgi:arsenate reductase
VGTLLGEGSWKDTALYAVAQTVGGCTGAIVANVMFDLDAINLSEKVRTGSNIWISEVVASVGLLVVIYGTIRAKRADLVPFTVAAWITGAYFFTSSTSLANPAVTVARTLSNTFAGIAPESVPMFIVMQLVGAVIGFSIIRFVFEESAA